MSKQKMPVEEMIRIIEVLAADSIAVADSVYPEKASRDPDMQWRYEADTSDALRAQEVIERIRGLDAENNRLHQENEILKGGELMI